MEPRVCGVNQLAAGVLLPPRKRLLANSEIDWNWRALCVNFPSPVTSGVFDAWLTCLLNSHSDKSNLSHEEIAEASISAAMTAAKAARAARALQEEKAAIAVKPMATAKNALDLVASFSEKPEGKDRYLKRNKVKKHVR
ncbi:hypothetical protein MLD38_029547 [Melastoma candidum]|uniref:Uncharacterized protein n=1 Tax=Melastoma candidum TaxID=119954 RepID=A0ACB9N9S8_9MYRT|nr:hypothetical protein MLD38_029547 [Melastoma candidum]